MSNRILETAFHDLASTAFRRRLRLTDSSISFHHVDSTTIVLSCHRQLLYKLKDNDYSYASLRGRGMGGNGCHFLTAPTRNTIVSPIVHRNIIAKSTAMLLCCRRDPFSQLPPQILNIILFTGSSDQALHSDGSDGSNVCQPRIAWQGGLHHGRILGKSAPSSEFWKAAVWDDECDGRYGTIIARHAEQFKSTESDMCLLVELQRETESK